MSDTVDQSKMRHNNMLTAHQYLVSIKKICESYLGRPSVLSHIGTEKDPETNKITGYNIEIHYLGENLPEEKLQELRRIVARVHLLPMTISHVDPIDCPILRFQLPTDENGQLACAASPPTPSLAPSPVVIHRN